MATVQMLPQRVALGSDPSGGAVIITREWYRLFEALVKAVSATAAATPTDPAVTAAIASLQAAVAALQAAPAATVETVDDQWSTGSAATAELGKRLDEAAVVLAFAR